MSLHKFAEQVAANGRGEDSLLVHMTPDEVRNLQKFAEANGTTLTINPETGLPEAGLLSDLFKSIAPIALGAFLGPAGFGLSSMMAGVATGGITALATGSLSRGLMAGLGAYGGAGLGESLMGASGMTGGAALGSGMPADMAFNLADAGVTDAGIQSLGNVDATSKAIAQAQPSAFDKVAAGAKAVTASPGAAMDFAKQNFGNLTAAAAPIMAGAMVPTTTKLPEPRDSGLIRQMAFNINPDTGRPDPLYGMREMTPVKASEFGNKTFQGQRDLFYQQNPNPYELGVGSLNQPPQQQPARMNTGGIVALAAGGPPTMMTDEQLYQKTGSWEAAAAARDVQNNALNAFNNQQAANARDNINNSLNQVDWKQQAETRDAAANAANAANFAKNPDASDWWAKQPGGVDALYSTINQQLAANPNMTDAQIDAAMKQYGISNEDVAAALRKGGGSQAQEYSMLAGNMGLSGLNTNINDWIAKARQDPTFRAKTGLQQQEAAMAAMGTVNMNEADVLRATGKTIAELFPSTLTKPVSVIPTGYYGNDTGNPLTRTPGDITTNADGTVTVHPNIPGRPDGGFTGMGQVRDTYTAGGGSLGYTASVPKTAAEHNALYNKQTDDSLDAYNFLMGKGKNLTQRTATADRPVMRRYDEAVLGRKIPKLTKATTTTKTDTKETVAGDTAVVGGVTFDLTEPTRAPAEDNNGPWSWDVVNKRWVQYGKFADGGMTGYAVGGGIGSLGSYSDGGRLLKGPGDGVSDSIPATIGRKQQPARLADGEFVIPARIVSELGNGSTDAGAKKLYAMMDRVQRARGKTTGKNKVAANSRSDKYLPA